MTEVFGGDIIDADDNNDLETRVTRLETSNSDDVTDAGTTSSTTYTSILAAADSLRVPFVAGVSGTVVVLLTGKLTNSTSEYSYMSFRLEDSGGTIIASSDTNGVKHYGTTEQAYTTHTVLTGLTPGTSYEVVVTHRVTGSSTGTFDDRRLAVLPA
jgi:hypothetical protein